MTATVTRALLDSEAEKVWRQNRAILVAAASPNNKCRCGSGKRIERDGPLVLSLCTKRRLWNFWKHDPPKVVLRY